MPISAFTKVNCFHAYWLPSLVSASFASMLRGIRKQSSFTSTGFSKKLSGCLWQQNTLHIRIRAENTTR